MSFRKQFSQNKEASCDKTSDNKIKIKVDKELNKLIVQENAKQNLKVDDYISYPLEKWTVNSIKSSRHNKENENTNTQQRGLSRAASQRINENQNVLINSRQLYNSKDIKKNKKIIYSSSNSSFNFSMKIPRMK